MPHYEDANGQTVVENWGDGRCWGCELVIDRWDRAIFHMDWDSEEFDVEVAFEVGD